MTKASQYLVDLDKNIQVYTKSGSGPSKNVGIGECVIGIGFLHDGITQINDNGYKNIQLIIPSSGTSFEVGATAMFKGAKHPTLRSCGSSTLCLPSALSSLPRTALTSSWSSTTPPSRRKLRSLVWIPTTL